MKLSYNRNSKNPIYYISQSIRNGKKTTSFNVCKIGKHSELLAQGIENPLEYAKNQVKKYNNSLLEEKVSYSIDINFEEKVSPSVENTSKSLSSNIGYFYLQHFYSNPTSSTKMKAGRPLPQCHEGILYSGFAIILI